MRPLGVSRHIGEASARADMRIRRAAHRNAVEHLGQLEELLLQHGVGGLLRLADHVDVVGTVDLLDVVPDAHLGAGLEGHLTVGADAVVFIVLIRGVLVRTDGGTNRDDAVILPPFRRDVHMADRVVDVATHVSAALEHHRVHAGVRQIVAGQRITMGVRAGDGEVINIILGFGIAVEHGRTVHIEVVDAQVIGVLRPDLAVDHTIEVAGIGLIGLAHQAPLVELEVQAEIVLVDIGAGNGTDDAHGILGQIADVLIDLRVILAAVVRRAKRRDALDPVAALAGKQRADGVVAAGVALVGVAVFKQLCKHADRLAAHAVADQMHFQLAVGVVQLRQDARERAAVAGMAIGGGVVCAVVDRAADKVGIQLAGTVPVTGNRTDRRGVDLVAGIVEDVAQAAEATPVVQAEHFRAAPTEQAVHQHDRIVVAVRGQQLRQIRVRQFLCRGRMIGVIVRRISSARCETGHAKHHGQNQNCGKHSAPRFLHRRSLHKYRAAHRQLPLF